MKPSKKGFKVGVKVELLQTEKPYGSGYGINPEVFVPKGSIGIVGATDVPYVWESKEKGHGDYFVCVDVELPGIFNGDPKHNNCTWRCGVNPKHLKIHK